MSSLPDALIRCLRRLPGNAQPDAALLRAFVAGDHEAFRTLVSRHGPLVLGICKRVLGEDHAAEDAFQATFLVLARRAGSMRLHGPLSAWLFGVARRVALKARTADRRRSKHETRTGTRPSRSTGPADELTARELLAALDGELARLPIDYREPLLLCYWQGLTQDQAARRLGCSAGAVKGRLERGRARLGERLRRRGFGPEALLLVPVAAIALPSDLVARTTGLAVAPWSATIPAAVVTLAAAPSKLVPAVVLSTLLAGAGMMALAAGGGSPADTPKLAPPPAQVAVAPPALDFRGDPLPPGAVARLGTIRFRAGGSFESVAFSPDGKTLITGSGGAELTLWDAATGRPISNMTINKKIPGSAEIAGVLPNGTVIASAGTFLPLTLCDVRAGRQLRSFGDTSNKERLTVAATSADGRFLACGNRDRAGTIVVFDIASGQETYHVEQTDPARLWQMAFSADGKVLVLYESAKNALLIRILDGTTGREVQRLPEITGEVRNVAVAPDGGLLAWSHSHFVTLWDIANRKQLHEWRAAPRRYSDRGMLAFSPDGKALAASDEGIVVLRDVVNGKEIRRWDTKEDHVGGMAFSPDGKRLALIGQSRRISIWDTTTGCELGGDDDSRGFVEQIAFSPDGRTAATAGHDSVIRRWDVATGRQVGRITSPYEHVTALTFTSDGRSLAAGGYEMVEPFNRGSIRWWDLATGAETGAADLPEGGYPLVMTPVHDLVFASSFKDSHQYVWDAATKRETYQIEPHRRGTHDGAFTPDGRRLVTSDAQNRLVVRDRDTGKVRAMAMPIPKRGPPHVAISPDGRTVAAAASRGDPCGLWEVASGQERRRFQSVVVGFSLAFSPDGRSLACTSLDDDSVKVLDVITGAERARYTGHRGQVRALAFSPDGRHVISGSYDTTALEWVVPPPEPVPAPADLSVCWAELAGADAAKAFTAHWQLAAVPGQAVSFLRERLRPAQPLEPARPEEIRRRIADLDSGNFTTRQQADSRLADIGPVAEPFLRDALTKAPSAEAKRRLEQLLDRSGSLPTSGDELRAMRTVEVLERIATPDARKLLGELAGGDANSRLTVDAKASLKRLDVRRD
jgi:RNA polymerase sigma factor (sigma-70 family)